MLAYNDLTLEVLHERQLDLVREASQVRATKVTGQHAWTRSLALTASEVMVAWGDVLMTLGRAIRAHYVGHPYSRSRLVTAGRS